MPAPYTSSVAETIAPDLLERFQRYVAIDTQSRRDQDRQPSTPGQLELSRLLVGELRAIGLDDARLDEHGYVYATLPTNQAEAPSIGVIAHVDTSPDAPGAGVTPLVHRDYDGGVIELPRHGTRLDPRSMPELSQVHGHDLVTGSGDTLLGADDKAGVAAIMAAVAFLASHPEVPRCRLCVGFTPDEEIGEGATRFDISGFGASFAYTVDGSELGELQDESFSAVEAVIRIDGVEVHPGQAYGKLTSALRLAAQIVSSLPSDRLTPETAGEREGFIHPYELTGTAAHAELRLILRDFDEARLTEHCELLDRTARRVMEAADGARMQFDVRRQYRNMRQFIQQAPQLVEAAEEAMRAEGIKPIRRAIRGGTDGSRLSEMGLLTPNLFDGGHEYHSVREWASVQEMAASAATVVRLAEVWARRTVDG
ncbi:MAG TPA: peptidase T [Solirubrobacteraceae bacterium]|jgi:tripeptide aminopeptidase|nr:peptidase T [Solirubrobacteraceae bacterium]